MDETKYVKVIAPLGFGRCYRNINRRDAQRKNVVNNVDKSSLWAP